MNRLSALLVCLLVLALVFYLYTTSVKVQKILADPQDCSFSQLCVEAGEPDCSCAKDDFLCCVSRDYAELKSTIPPSTASVNESFIPPASCYCVDNRCQHDNKLKEGCTNWYESGWNSSAVNIDLLTDAGAMERWLTKEEWSNYAKFNACDCAVYLLECSRSGISTEEVKALYGQEACHSKANQEAQKILGSSS